MINYNNKTFRSVTNTANGDVSTATQFFYKQSANIVTAVYSGGNIVSGHLIAIAAADGKLDMRYHHVNINGEIMTGICFSTPEQLPNGKLRLHENWQWTSGDKTSGSSIIEEV
jgi:hypothetical protein